MGKVPVPSRVSDQLNLSGNIVALLEWDNTLWDTIVLPDGVDRQQVTDNILLKAGHRALLHPNPHYMKWAHGVWSKRMLPVWVKLIATTEYDYNPIHNYDRKEEYTDIRNIGRKTGVETGYEESITGRDSNEREEFTNTHNSRSDNTIVTHEVSAENTETYQPDSRDTTDGSIRDNGGSDSAITDSGSNSSSTTGNSTQVGAETTEDTFTHTAHLYGNIGVTTTQQMIEAEREVVRFNIIDEIVDSWIDEFCLYVW